MNTQLQHMQNLLPMTSPRNELINCDLLQTGTTVGLNLIHLNIFLPIFNNLKFYVYSFMSNAFKVMFWRVRFSSIEAM